MGIPPSSIPWLAMGSGMLCVGWFGFNVMSAQSLKGVSGLVAINSLLAMCGGILAAVIAGDNDPGFVHNGALAGLVAVCAGSDVMHPIGAFITGGLAGVIFVYMFQHTTNVWKIDDVLGVWPLHGLCGLWGGIACGIFGLKMFGGLGVDPLHVWRAGEDPQEARCERRPQCHGGAGETERPAALAKRGEIADILRHENERAGCRLGEAEPVEHLARREPSIVLHHVLRHVGEHGIGAAECHHGELGEEPGDVDEDVLGSQHGCQRGERRDPDYEPDRHGHDG